MSRFLSKLAVVALFAAALALIHGSATAETRHVRDASGDAAARLDIRKVSFNYADGQIVVSVGLGQRFRSNVHVQANVDPGRRKHGGLFFLTGYRSDGQVKAELSFAPTPDGGGEEVACPGASGTYRPQTRTVRLSVPVSCLRRHESPRQQAWIGAVTYSGAGLDCAPETPGNRPGYIRVPRG